MALSIGGILMVGSSGIALAAIYFVERAFPTHPETTRLSNFEHYNADKAMRVGSCFLTSGTNSIAHFNHEECLRQSKEKPNVLIIGDSHAAHWVRGIQISHPKFNILQATASGCKPSNINSGEKRCTDLMKFIIDAYLPTHPVDLIIISARWQPEDVLGAIQTAGALSAYAKSVWIYGPIVEYAQPLPRLLSKAVEGALQPDQYATRFMLPVPSQADHAFKQTPLPSGVNYISIIDLICPTKCQVFTKDYAPMQFDYGHLTTEGATALASRLGLSMALLHSPP